MFRMLQALERVPSSQQKKTVPGEEAVPATSKRYNPHKYLLFRPTLSQLLVYAAAGFKVGWLSVCLFCEHPTCMSHMPVYLGTSRRCSDATLFFFRRLPAPRRSEQDVTASTIFRRHGHCPTHIVVRLYKRRTRQDSERCIGRYSRLC